ncbi:MAG TPA: CBS domain-containing protein [Pyrinomonadaceae bacterium]|jgi:CBS domain-containing protein/gamma-glutamyl:cysteine ligase YbdK (ATP-grasp superfamily)
MGEQDVKQASDELQQRAYMKALLDDLRALELMLEGDTLESGVRRIGSEQEMFLVDSNLGPAPVAEEVLARLDDERFVTEIGRFNLEANLTPHLLGGRCFSRMEEELSEVLRLAREGAHACGVDVLLGGILPTLAMSDLRAENMTPRPRYHELNRVIGELRGGTFSAYIKGRDELHIKHDNILLASCNASFQIHLQVNPREFAAQYNLAQAITAPLLAAAVNSPLLFGRRLWQETRVALFQHSNDSRTSAEQSRSQPTRVGFGEGWLKDSVIELFREQIARFRVIMTNSPDEDPLAVLARGEAPSLSALRLHNGTIWPWNRACYGISEGRPHLRIENRALPGGPTVLDEVANAAFFTGLMTAPPGEYGEVSERMAFDDARANFFAAARYGLRAQLTWMDGKRYIAAALILDRLLPLAREGLRQSGVEEADVERYLGTLEERVRSGQTGAQWMLQSLESMGEEATSDLRQRKLAAAMLERQQGAEPVHQWEVIKAYGSEGWRQITHTVGHLMSTDLFTVRPDDLVEMVARVMEWRDVRHVPVEDEEGRLVGIVSHRSLLRMRAESPPGEGELVAVRQIMNPDPISVAPTTLVSEAVELMRSRRVGSLPVVEGGRLVGIVTVYDFLESSARLSAEEPGAGGRSAE